MIVGDDRIRISKEGDLVVSGPARKALKLCAGSYEVASTFGGALVLKQPGEHLLFASSIADGVSVMEVFNLASIYNWTGCAQIAAPDVSFSVAVTSGELVWASSDSPRLSLARAILTASLEGEVLDHALEPESVFQRLVDGNAMSSETLREQLRAHAEEVFFRANLVERGSVAFFARPPVAGAFSVGLPLQALLLRCAERADESGAFARFGDGYRDDDVTAPTVVPPPMRSGAVVAPSLGPDLSAPESFEDLFRKATTAYVCRDFRAAKDYFERCAALRPEDERVQANLRKLTAF